MGPIAAGPPVPASIVALAALQSEGLSRAGAVQHVARLVIDKLDSEEAAALRNFGAAGRRCIEALRPGTMRLLSQLSQAMSAGVDDEEDEDDATTAVPESSSDERNVRELFRKYDVDRDGRLSMSQFREVFIQLGLGESFTEDDIDALASIVDANGDGHVDVHEFLNWLYAGAGAPMEEPYPPRGKKGAGGAAKTAAVRPSELAEAREALATLQRELAEARSSLAASQKQLAAKGKELQQAEEELESAHDFWRELAQVSAGSPLPRHADVAMTEQCRWLGNGHYGFVLLAPGGRGEVTASEKLGRRASAASASLRQVVVKLMGLRWAHLAFREWGAVQQLGEHPCIVRYDQAVLHADSDGRIAEMLREGFQSGSLQTKAPRAPASFPDRWICLLQEYMNRGTVQDWMDKEMLSPGGIFVVIRQVANALSFMHSKGLTHNDIKPANVMLSQAEGKGPQAAVTVKLGDLGLAVRSASRTADFSLFGMTVLCMVTGEQFGSRKYRSDCIDLFVADVAALAESSGCSPSRTRGSASRPSGLCGALADLPNLLRQIFREQLSMTEIRDYPAIQGVGFFDVLESNG